MRSRDDRLREEVDGTLRRSDVDGRSLATVLLDVDPRPAPVGCLAIASCLNPDCGEDISTVPIGLAEAAADTAASSA